MKRELKNLNNRFPGKTAFITGAGSGLGASFTQLLLDNNWSLHLADLRPETLDRFKDSDKVEVYSLDVGNKTEYQQIVKKVSESVDHIDLLINNAGIGDGSFFDQYDIGLWEKMIQVNLMGTVYGSKYFIPLMKSEPGGIIINIGSAAGFMNAPGMSAYNVSKAAVYSFSETLLYELKNENIHVCVATPTFFKTNIMQDAQGSDAFVQFAEKQMKYSKTNADEMAEVILNQAAQGKFQVIFPREAKRNHFLKKWFPGLVEKKIDKMLTKFKAT